MRTTSNIDRRCVFVTFLLACLLLGAAGGVAPAFAQRKRTAPRRAPASDRIPATTVDRYAAMHGLSSLRQETFGRDESEIRVWVGFGVFFPRALILSDRKGVRTVTHITGKLDAARKPVVVRSLPLKVDNDPKSPCRDFSLGRMMAGSYVPDADWADPDEISMVVELRRGKTYKRISYRVGSESSGGKQIAEYVRKLEKLYEIKLMD